MESGTTSTTVHARYRLANQVVFAFFDSQSALFTAPFPRGGAREQNYGFQSSVTKVKFLALLPGFLLFWREQG